MRTQEVPRFPDETFYFDKSQQYPELVVDQAVLGDGPWPNVEVYADRSVIMTAENQDGETYTRGYSEVSQHRLFPRERIAAIRTGSDRPREIEVAEGMRRRFEPGGEQTGEYVTSDKDELIVKRQLADGSELDKIMVFPVRTFLPENNLTSYQALGIVRPDGVLVAWGTEARNTHRLIDLVNASALARDQNDLRRLTSQLVGEVRLTGIVMISEPVCAYLGYFLKKFGVDLMPTHDPRER